MSEALKGRVAVVTGAASGIGNAIATAFIEAGTSVLLCDVDAEGLDAAAQARRSCHRPCH
jgi:NAD(P)-dependent dehydrogenase (short-subunit alcohol dehydrogenase family)